MRLKESILKELENSVKTIYDTDGKEIPFKKFVMNYEKGTNRSSFKDVLSVTLDDNKITVGKKKVTYLCKCGSEHTIWMKKFLTKERLVCNHCSNDEEKTHNHSLFWKLGYQPRVMPEKMANTYCFDDETKEFKETYFGKHLRKDEFERILPYIVSIDDVEVNEKTKIKYFEYYPIKNQYKYHPYVNIDGKDLPFRNVYMVCDVCNKKFRISDSRSKREKLLNKGIFCRQCTFANYSFPIKVYTTVFGDKITYQGKLEKRFIDECDKSKIKLVNGPKINYRWNDTDRVYISDFFLPQFNLIVEIKENHIWHRRQLENGKWQCKEKSAIEFCKEHKYDFKLLFSKDIDNFITSLRDSLDNTEKC